jgi:hypothetical protein
MPGAPIGRRFKSKEEMEFLGLLTSSRKNFKKLSDENQKEFLQAFRIFNQLAEAEIKLNALRKREERKNKNSSVR